MFKRKRKLALILTLAMVFAALGSFGVVASAPENLIPNGSFEDNTGTSLAQWTKTGDAVIKTEEGSAQDGNTYMSLWADRYSRIEITVPAKEKTTYLLSFYYKASKVDSGTVSIEYKKDAQGVYAYMKEYNFGGDPTMDGSGFKFGSEQSVDALTWKKAEFPFTTSIYTNTIVLKIGGISDYRDESLSVDNVSLTEVEGTPNLIPGGSFEHSLDSENDQLIPILWSTENNPTTYDCNVSLFKDDNDVLLPSGEHCLKTASTFNDKQFLRHYNNIFLMEGNYKLTFRHMLEKVGEPADERYGFSPVIGLRASDISGGKPHEDWTIYCFNGVPEKEKTWYDYTIYFTVPEGAPAHGYKFDIELGYAGQTFGVHYYDDFVLTYDETYIDFGKDYNISVTSPFQQNGKFNFISEINNTDAADEIQVRAHYVPESETDEAYTLISCVYEYDETAKTKKLHTIEIANSAPETNGKISTLVDTITVPKAEDGITYKVEAFLWNSVSGLAPVLNSATLAE